MHAYSPAAITLPEREHRQLPTHTQTARPLTFVITGHVGPWLVSPAIVGLLTVVAGLAGPKLVHHRLERAKRLNT